MRDTVPSEASSPVARPFSMKPVLLASLLCTMAMMGFIAIIGPAARVLGMPPWQAGAAVTVGGVAWMLLSRRWGAASDHHGRRNVLLVGVGGFTLAYAAMCAVLAVSLHVLPAAGWVFAGLVLTRGCVGGCYAAIPATGQALIADHVVPEGRAAALAALGAANAVGVVMGPALAGALAGSSLSLPLYATALLPVIGWLVLWQAIASDKPVRPTETPDVRLADARLRRPMVVAFVAMASVSAAQITVGFLAVDRLGLAPALAARAAGIALTAVGIGLIGSQLVVRRLGWRPMRLIRVGAIIGAAGFGSTALVTDSTMLALSFFVAAVGMGWVFPAISALAANAVQAHEQGAAAGSVGAAQGLGIVVGPLAGALLYAAGPGVPYGVVALALVVVAVWPAPRSGLSKPASA